MIKLETDTDTNIIHVELSGKLESEDYAEFGPQIEAAIQKHGKIRILVKLKEFHGWTAGALWEDTKFDAKHFADIERLALVGETAWQKGMAVFCKPFTKAEVRYFDISETDKAEEWIKENKE